MRIKIIDSRDRFTIKIPVIKNPYVIIPLFVSFFLWVVGLFAIKKFVYTSFSTWVEMGIIIIGLVWLIIGFFLLKILSWLLTGSEIVKIDSQSLHTQKPLLVYRRTRTYPLKDIHNLRVDKEVFQRKKNGIWLDDVRTVIKFDTSYKVVTFGRGINEDEAQFIILQLASCKYLIENNFANKHNT